MEFDGSTGLPKSETYEQPSPTGPPADVEEIFSDWREVDGLKVPFKLIIQENGGKFADVTVQELKLNSGLKVEDLSKKP